MLARLALRSRRDVPDDPSLMRVIDPACGTGTLLMATGERMRDLCPDVLGNVLIEDVLSGTDINVTATHMAATTLGLLSPTTKFSKMNISAALLGVDDDGNGRAGSLEMYDKEGLLPDMGWHTAPSRQIDSHKPMHVDPHSIDLVIMNPPFTRNDVRHDQLGLEAEKKVKTREMNIFDKTQPKPDRRSSGPMFVMLADHLLNERGVLAAIRPMTASNDSSERELRPFLASRYNIDMIVVPHDPERFYFSENTGIWEMLIVLRRGSGRDARIVKLIRNPSTVVDAISLAEKINSSTEDETSYIEMNWPRKMVDGGDWAGVLFFSEFLVRQFLRIRGGDLFKTVPLGDVSVTTDPRKPRAVFKKSKVGGRDAMRILHGHDTDTVRSMHAEPNQYIRAANENEEGTKAVWEKRSFLQVTERVRLNTVRVFAVHVDDRSIGTSWHAVRPLAPNGKPKTGEKNVLLGVDARKEKDSPEKVDIKYAEQWSKAMTAYLNSTVGVVALLGVRTPRVLSYPHFGGSDIKAVPVPVPTKKTIKRLAKTYKKHADKDLGPISERSEIRAQLDKDVCADLEIDSELVSRIRTELSREPMITNKRYDSRPLGRFT